MIVQAILTHIVEITTSHISPKLELSISIASFENIYLDTKNKRSAEKHEFSSNRYKQLKYKLKHTGNCNFEV